MVKNILSSLMFLILVAGTVFIIQSKENHKNDVESLKN